MRILIARRPVQASWPSFPCFYDKAEREPPPFAGSQISIKDMQP